MPELPEVETITRRLCDPSASLIGSRVTGVALLWPKTFSDASGKTPPQGQEALAARLVGRTLAGISRRGKFILFDFAGDTLLIHLRMSGDLRVEAIDAPLQTHDRFWMALTGTAGDQSSSNTGGPARLAFNDTRKFGRIWLARDPQEVLGNLGPEPLDPGFTQEMLYDRLQASARQLKPLLLDQTFLAGLGNIYADEALHLARLHPLSLSSQITGAQAEALWSAIRSVLEEGIRRNGASIDWVYRGGEFQNHFRVYQRTGEPCPVCGTPIQRILVGQRGTHFCPVCQVKV